MGTNFFERPFPWTGRKMREDRFLETVPPHGGNYIRVPTRLFHGGYRSGVDRGFGMESMTALISSRVRAPAMETINSPS